MNTHTDEFASNAGQHANVFGEFLDSDTLRCRAPAVYAPTAHESTSPTYSFLSTQKLLEALSGAGFLPVEATQTTTRVRSPLHSKHMVRLRRRYETVELSDSIPELVLLNSHDGSSAYQLRMGIYRPICRNGLIICDGTFPVWRVAHRGNILDELIAAALRIAERFESLAVQVERMMRTILHPDQGLAFATRATEIRYPKGVPNGLYPGRLLRPRREEDIGNDVWHTYNVVQENLLRGGMRLLTDQGRLRSTRGISSIRQNVRLNTALWEAAVALVS